MPYVLRLLVDAITLHEAWAFAQLPKRAGWDHHRALAIDENEAISMQAFAERLRQALAQHGYAPR
ncbi:MAG: DUF7706 family protein [Acidiferrobacter sp.]